MEWFEVKADHMTDNQWEEAREFAAKLKTSWDITDFWNLVIFEHQTPLEAYEKCK